MTLPWLLLVYLMLCIAFVSAVLIQLNIFTSLQVFS